ncbi:SNF2 family N-terminal domain-containing protein [Trichoderma novae-zelandiae]
MRHENDPGDPRGSKRRRSSSFDTCNDSELNRKRIAITDLIGPTISEDGVCQLMRSSLSQEFPVTLKDSQNFESSDVASIKGLVDPGFTYITDALLGEQDLKLEVTCSLEAGKSSKARFATPLSTPCRLNVTLFGDISLLEEVGSFFEDHDLYLQDPVGCSRNVLYRNPHKLCDASGPAMWTSDLGREHAKSAIIESTQPRPELIDVLNSQEDLVEAKQPGSIRSAMKSFVNRVSGAAQAEPPQQFYGGIIADSMGLGKTLSMISLIASDLLLNRSDPNSVIGANAEESSGRTLIVVPPPLLDAWEEQLNQHVFPNSIPWRRHHGKFRIANEIDLEEYLVILTTYQTISSEWSSNSDKQQSLLFKTQWRRIILDEAHFIRNSGTRMARAVCSLASVSRWAVTGTPIQNRLGDLTALLRFLRLYPYSEEHRFNTDISHLWKMGRIDEAVKRLKRLAGCILLRRPKTVIQLPPRHDFKLFVELAPAERHLYQNFKTRTLSHIEQALSVDGRLSQTYSYASMLQRIEAMRMICNLGVYYKVRYDLQAYNEQTSQSWTEAAQQMFNIRRGMSSIQCRLCLGVADSTEGTIDEAEPPAISLFSQCLEFICFTCLSTRSTYPVLRSCSHETLCPTAPISTDIFDTDDASSLTTGQLGAGLPTKISLLIQDLQSLSHEVKCVVFSSWRTTLEIVEVGLKQAGIPCLRFDGKVAQKDRHAVVERFRKDPTVRVLLLTLSCGAVEHLTLTEASRAYLMEPHWNPTLEDQALARIHRIGQTKEVHTIRFIVKDSFEEVCTLMIKF